MVTATPHEDLEAFFDIQRQLADEKQARSGHLHPKFGGPIADGWQLTVGHGHSGFGIYAHMEAYPEEGAIFWRTLNDVQNEAYAEGRKDEREQALAAIEHVRDHICAGGDGVTASMERQIVGPYLDSVIEALDDDSRPSAWRPIETAPEDEHILIATTGGHVGTAYWTDEGDGKVWAWGHPQKDHGQYVHPNLEPLGWMPLPKHPASPTP